MDAVDVVVSTIVVVDVVAATVVEEFGNILLLLSLSQNDHQDLPTINVVSVSGKEFGNILLLSSLSQNNH